MRHLVAGLAALAALGGCGPAKAPTPAAKAEASATPSAIAPTDALSGAARPALWRTGDADTTIYFFGTVHVLPPDLNWRTAAIDKAIGEAKAVYFETDLDPPAGQMETIVGRLGLYPRGQSLSDHLDAAQRRTLAEAASKLSVSMTQLDTMRPWLAMIALNQPMTLMAGYQPESGVERSLQPTLADQHKEVRKLETVEEQLLAFADLPEPVQVDYLIHSLKDLDRNTDLLNALVRAWAAGDVEKLDQLLNEDDKEDDPAVAQALLTNRNRNWSVKLDQLIRSEPGVFFVAVGAAHLTGEDSVPALLTAKGYKVVRVE